MSRFCIPKKLTKKEINRVDKAIWETLKHTRIIEQRKLKEQDSNKEVFYVLLKSPS